jgi:ABC-type iron transport system FetAB permease component
MDIIKLLIEAVFVGIAILIIGRIIFCINSTDINIYDDKLNVNLFLVGFVGHFMFEFTGINELYCKYGHASN